MTDTLVQPVADGSGTPRSLWLVGIASLLWNSLGGVDYTMTVSRNAAYLAKMPADQLAYVESFPAWAVALWAVGVWGAIAGSILLLMRRRIAVIAFAASFVGLALLTLYEYVLSHAPPSMMQPSMYVMTALLWIVALALLAYARRQAARGVLR